jgi:para-nitrobenzyl esterase
MTAQRSSLPSLWLFLSAAILAVAVAFGAAAEPFPSQVHTQSGVLAGASQDGVLSFKGVPFAAPPTGELRWRPPQPAASWQGVRQATAYGHDCMQKPFPSDAAPLGTTPDEDCLVLNVWRPAERTGAKLPVMVWIYGGGFVNGGSSPAVYDGSQFARRGIVFVSFNYRLGRFGFFAFPALSKEGAKGPLGNYAYMDQIAALAWVKRNIAAFGGDPGNVTVFGESAGGGSVHALLTSPMARGLFHKAIIESGGGRGSLLAAKTVADAEKVGIALAKANGIEGEGPEALAALRRLPAEKLVDGLNMASMGAAANTYVGGPILDGKIVVENPDQAYRAGRQAKVPVMIGANSADIGFSFARNMDELLTPYGARREKARAVYDPAGSGDVRAVGARMTMDKLMVEPARLTAQLIAAQGLPAYEYRFSYVASSMRSQWPGALHATEIPFVFDTVAAKYGKDLTAEDEATARAANAYWANFARTGDPNGAGLPHWPAYQGKTDQIMDFTPTGPLAKADPWKPRLDVTAQAAAGR